MKKIYLIISVLAAVVFASCSRESITDNGTDIYGPNTIAFVIEEEPLSKAGEVLSSKTVNLGECFGQNLILQETITESGSYNYSPFTKGTPATNDNVIELYNGKFQADFFVPKDPDEVPDPSHPEHFLKNIDFNYDAKHHKWIHTFPESPFKDRDNVTVMLTMPGYTPYDSIGFYTHSLISLRHYTVPSNIEDQKDLLVARADFRNNYNPIEGFKVTFKHALTGVRFVADIPEGIKLKSISLENLYGTGNCFHNPNARPPAHVFEWEHSAGTPYSSSYTFNTEEHALESEETTFWVIPQKLLDAGRDEVTLVLVFTNSDESQSETIPIKLDKALRGESGNHVEWFAGELHTITLKLELPDLSVHASLEDMEYSDYNPINMPD